MTIETASSSRLSTEQVCQYRQEGFLVYPDPVFPQHKFDALKAHFEQRLSELPADIRPEAMGRMHYTDTKLFDWLFADEVLDLVEPIIGPDIALFGGHFICKPKGDGKRVPWHEDAFYWTKTVAPVDVVTVWLAIDPSTEENGAMTVIPRALGGGSEYAPVDTRINTFAEEIKPHQRNDSQAVTIELQPNHASLHDCRLVHGSPPNSSSLRRCGYTMRYMPATAKLLDEALPHHQIYLARGKDRAGNVYGDPTKTYPERAQFVVKGARAGH